MEPSHLSPERELAVVVNTDLNVGAERSFRHLCMLERRYRDQGRSAEFIEMCRTAEDLLLDWSRRALVELFILLTTTYETDDPADVESVAQEFEVLVETMENDPRRRWLSGVTHLCKAVFYDRIGQYDVASREWWTVHATFTQLGDTQVASVANFLAFFYQLHHIVLSNQDDDMEKNLVGLDLAANEAITTLQRQTWMGAGAHSLQGLIGEVLGHTCWKTAVALQRVLMHLWLDRVPYNQLTTDSAALREFGLKPWRQLADIAEAAALENWDEVARIAREYLVVLPADDNTIGITVQFLLARALWRLGHEQMGREPLEAVGLSNVKIPAVIASRAISEIASLPASVDQGKTPAYGVDVVPSIQTPTFTEPSVRGRNMMLLMMIDEELNKPESEDDMFAPGGESRLPVDAFDGDDTFRPDDVSLPTGMRHFSSLEISHH